MKTLAIETSCDDTSVAIVQWNNNQFHVEKIYSYTQIADHQQYGGIVPEIASRLHAEKITAILEYIGRDTCQDVDTVSVTTQPGLPGSLVVGKTSGHLLSAYRNKLFVPVNHIHGHIFSILLERDISTVPLPWMILTASGGHNELYLVDAKPHTDMQSTQLGQYRITRIGHTLDDAAGECFDKVSRILGGPYPGGAWVGQRATLGREREDIHFKRIFLSADSYMFSFSGMKSQVHYLLQDLEKRGVVLDAQLINDICFAFQEAVVEVLAKKLVKAAIQYNAQTIGIVGGVSANTRLREYTQDYKEKKIGSSVTLVKPTRMDYCTDNAAMIGVVGILTS